MLILKQLGEELPYLLLRCSQGLLSGSRRTICSPTSAPIPLFLRAQQAAGFEPMQHRIDRACAEPVTVPSQLFDHSQPKDWLLAGVVQNVQPNET